MNITRYVNDESKAQLFHGRMSLQTDYSIVNAEENIYRYLGANSGRIFTALIHPDDLQDFEECVERADQKPQYLLFRLLSEDEKYRYIYAIIRRNSKSIDMEIVDIANNHKKFDNLRDTAFKCKKIMNYSENAYFEYFYDSRTINIYEYVNERSIVHFNRKIDEFYDEVMQESRYTARQKKEFMVLYEALIDNRDNLNVSLDGSIFGMEQGVLEIKGGIIYKHGERQLLTGTIKRLGNERTGGDEKYYKTSYAVEQATGTYNKRAISELAIDILASSDNDRRYIIMLDIDDFKNVNDTFGHMTGDEVIAKTAEILKHHVRERGYVGRFGGDEFFIILDKVNDEESLVYLLKTIRKNLAWDCMEITPGLKITLSMGVSCYPEDGKTYDELLMIADKCLYLAKTKGKNRYVIYRPMLHGDLEKVKNSKMLSINNLFEDNYHVCCAAMAAMNDIRDKNVSMERCLERVRQEFAVDGITIYKGIDFERIISSGEYSEPMLRADYLKEEQGELMLDENGMFCVNKILNIKEKWPRAYESLEKQGNIGILVIRQGDVAISYDLFGRLRKWSDLDKGLLLMIGKALVERISNLQ